MLVRECQQSCLGRRRYTQPASWRVPQSPGPDAVVPARLTIQHNSARYMLDSFVSLFSCPSFLRCATVRRLLSCIVVKFSQYAVLWRTPVRAASGPPRKIVAASASESIPRSRSRRLECKEWVAAPSHTARWASTSFRYLFPKVGGYVVSGLASGVWYLVDPRDERLLFHTAKPSWRARTQAPCTHSW